MECQRCGKNTILFRVKDEGLCESCIRKDPKLELVPYSKEEERRLGALMKHPAKWYKEVRTK
ncbi:MAG: hypothetical protein HYS81_01975 [Candidatus Aenigmatarchaeota archaeon]|nr:MAG: hypothetical protein HYS81_01975 [Candidatus Aenigmarchaeota archaeon]